MDTKLRVFFYQLVAVSLFFRTRRLLVITSIITALHIINYLFIYFEINLTTTIAAWLAMVTNPIIFEFIIGYILACNFEKIVLCLQNISIKLTLLLGALSLTPVLLELKTIFWIEDPHISTMFIPAIIIFLCTIRLMYVERWHLPNLMKFTAKISYSIYLLHMAVMFVVIYLSKFFLGVNVFDSFSARFNLLVIVIITTWIVSFIFHIIVENRLSKIFKRVVLSCFKD